MSSNNKRGTKRKTQQPTESLPSDTPQAKKQKTAHQPNKTSKTIDLTSSPSTPSTPTSAKSPTISAASAMFQRNNKRPTATTVKKTINIKPLKVKPTLPENFEEDTWNKLKASVQAVYRQEDFNTSQEELYKAVQDLCIHKLGANLYEKLRGECERHAHTVLTSLVNQTPDHAAYLSLVVKTWEDYCNQLLTIRSIFLYLDRTYVIQTSGIRSLWDMGLQFFRRHVMQNNEVESKVVSGLLYLIERERHGDSIDRSVVRILLRMFISLQVYEDTFETVFLEKTKEFYELEGSRLVEDLNVPEYLIHVENRLKQESDRASHYLAQSTRKSLINVTEKQLIENHVRTILSKGFDDLVTMHRLSDLARLYSLLSLVNGVEPLKEVFAEYIRKGGLAIVSDEEKDKTMVEDFLAFKLKMDEIYEKAFQRHDNIKYAVRFAYEKAINSRQNKPAELIAKYLDSKLKSGNKVLSEEELEKVTDDALVLFRLIDGKDVFEAFYKKDLAKRLLLSNSASTDAEKTMITKLKTECGSNFTSKLEGMFKDMEVSKDIMGQFEESKEYQQLKEKELDMTVTVITTGYWPSYNPEPVILPLDIGEAQNLFQKFYLDKHTGRTLKFQNTLGQCTLKAVFPAAKKELQVSVFQAVVLLQFNDVDQLSFKEITQATGIQEKELKRTLESLTTGKTKVIKKLSKEKEIQDTESFIYNKEFTHPLVRIKINQIQAKETEEEQTVTTEKVLIERQYVIDAAIVKLMKARKKLSHQDLMREVMPLLRFPCKGSEIKKRIESLIERDYLEREAPAGSGAQQTASTTVYKYMA